MSFSPLLLTIPKIFTQIGPAISEIQCSSEGQICPPAEAEAPVAKKPEIRPETKLRPKTEGLTGDRSFTGDRSPIHRLPL